MLYYGRTDICEEIDPATSIFDSFALQYTLILIDLF